jgi:hypothetical protein
MLGLGLREATRPDARLVRECLRGSGTARTALVERYQNLIYSLPIKRVHYAFWNAETLYWMPKAGY